MANQYSQPNPGKAPPGKVWIPTPLGPIAMTLDEARTYLRTHPSSFTDPNNPNLSPWLREAIQDPRIQQALQSGATTSVKVGETTFDIRNGQVTHYTTGGITKPIVLALATAATAGLAGGAFGGGGAAAGGGTAASTTAPVTAGGAGAGGAGAAGASSAGTAAGVAGLEAGVPLSTIAPSSLPGFVPASQIGPQSTGILGGIGRFLGSAGGATALGVAGQLGGAAIQSSGIAKAAEIEAAFQREALAYEKERDKYLQNLEASRYGELSGRLQPYIATGQSANDRMAMILGLDPSGHGYTPPVSGAPTTGGGADRAGAAPPVAQPAPTSMAGSVGGGVIQAPAWPGAKGSASPGQTVMLRAPDGSTRAVPADQAAHYIQRGAQPVMG